jgi:hypothetical protein
MKANLDRRLVLAAGLAIIAVANAVTLGYAAYNRVGQPDSELRLTNRELWLNGGRTRDENSSVSVGLAWCAEPSATDTLWSQTTMRFFDCGGRSPGWLDQDRLNQLGFDFTKPPTTPQELSDQSRQRARRVFLVFELDGPQHQRTVATARKRVSLAAADSGVQSDTSSIRLRLPRMRAALAELENESPRLYVIDAGLHHEELRTRYPDRTRYAIMRGLVRPIFESSPVGPGGKTNGIRGVIQRLENESINVPAKYRHLVLSKIRTRFGAHASSNAPALDVQVAFGRRLEPWITRVISRDK